jgi:hypothetical protein
MTKVVFCVVVTIRSVQCNFLIKIDKKQVENVEEFYLGSMITNDARCTQEIKVRIAMAKAAFNKKKTPHQQIRLRAKEETSEVATFGA